MHAKCQDRTLTDGCPSTMPMHAPQHTGSNFASLLLFSCLTTLLWSAAALAIDPAKEEKKLLTQCEKRLCTAILQKAPKRGMLRCRIGKTWGEKKIKKGAEQKKVGWTFGDAQCRAVLRLKRRDIIGALTTPKYTLQVAPHTVNCDVETSEGVKPLTAKLAPKLKFKNGKVYKVWVKLKDIEGPPGLSNLIWTVAKLEDSLGIFHSEIVEEINEFVHKKCKRNYGAKARARKNRKKKNKARIKKSNAKLPQKAKEQ